MTLSDLASIGGLVSSFAVLVSLVYLNLQVRQSDRNQQAQIRQNRSLRLSAQSLELADPAVAEGVAKGMAATVELSAVELVQFSYFARARFFGAEDDFYQHSEGLLDDGDFTNFTRSVRQAFIAAPGLRLAWPMHREAFGTDFVKFVEDLIASTPLAPPVDALAKWKVDAAALKAAMTA